MISIIRILGKLAPAPTKKRGILSLFRLTASAFGSPVPALAGLTFDQCLSEYARFTRSEALKLSPSGGNGEATRERLFQGGRTLGGRIRKLCMIASFDEAVTAMKIVYGTIGIQALPEEGGVMNVKSCYFSGAYPPEVCRLMSALDDGIFAGLSGGGRLKFGRRITEGYACCSAETIPPEKAG